MFSKCILNELLCRSIILFETNSPCFHWHYQGLKKLWAMARRTGCQPIHAMGRVRVDWVEGKVRRLTMWLENTKKKEENAVKQSYELHLYFCILKPSWLILVLLAKYVKGNEVYCKWRYWCAMRKRGYFTMHGFATKTTWASLSCD